MKVQDLQEGKIYTTQYGASGVLLRKPDPEKGRHVCLLEEIDGRRFACLAERIHSEFDAELLPLYTRMMTTAFPSEAAVAGGERWHKILNGRSSNGR